MSLIYNATFDSQTRVISLLDKAGNVISSCEVPSKELIDDITKPLTFKATQDGSTVKLTKSDKPSGAFQTSTDGGNTWADYTLDSAITLNTGDEVSFRAKVDRSKAQGVWDYFYFSMTGKIEAWHNVMSMYRTNDFATYESVVKYAFRSLFDVCTSLTKAPALPATTLSEGCYFAMFNGCRSLTKAPELRATILPYRCYDGMFSGCQSLTKAPVLPATTLAEDCYSFMFSGCQSLTKAPELPATTLAVDCYYRMFLNCRSLTKAPELPATTLADRCYDGMFSGCQSLKEVRIAATTTATDAMKDWLKDVSATGDFYCDPNATIFPTDSASGIPKGWTRVPAVDDPNKPLMLRAIEDNSSVTLGKYGTLSNTYQTSTDGTNWTDYTLETKISLNKGESVYFRCSNHPTTQTSSNYVRFYMMGKIEAWHNAYSMISSSFTDTSASVGSYGMFLLFAYCEALTKAPLLLNALAEHCYDGLFYYCSSLTKAPSLPATTLAEHCYDGLFGHCRSLKEVRIAATTTATNALYYWLDDVSATGDFYCDPNATIFPSGASGIPSGWRRLNIADYPTT